MNDPDQPAGEHPVGDPEPGDGSGPEAPDPEEPALASVLSWLPFAMVDEIPSDGRMVRITR